MERKDWLVPLITGVIGILGTVSGGVLTAYYQDRLAMRQVRVDQIKTTYTERAIAVKELKDAGVRYLTAQDAFLNAVLLSSDKDKAVLEQLTKLLAAGAEVIIVADDDLVRYTHAVNASTAAVLLNRNQSMEQRMDALTSARADWMKQLKRSLENLVAEGSDNLSATGQTTLLKR